MVDVSIKILFDAFIQQNGISKAERLTIKLTFFFFI